MRIVQRFASSFASAQSRSQVLSLLETHASTPANATAAVHRLAILSGSKPKETVEDPIPFSLQKEIQQHVPQLSQEQISRQAWAIGRLGGKEARALLPRLSARVQAHPPAIASVSWASATLRLGHAFPISLAAGCLCRMRPQDAANTLWAAATLRLQEPLRTPLDSTVIEARWASRDVAAALWAYATAQSNPGRETLQTFCEASSRTAHQANGQDVSNMLWALATLDEGAASPGRLHVLAEAVSARSAGAPRLRPQELANSVWALAACGVHHKGFFGLVRMQLTKSAALRELRQRDRAGDLLANVAWAFSIAAHLLGREPSADATLMEAIQSEMLEHGRAQDRQDSPKIGIKTRIGTSCFSNSAEIPDAISTAKDDSTNGIATAKNVARDDSIAKECASRPRILQHSGGISVVYKPEGWEVDGRGSSAHVTSQSYRMSGFVQDEVGTVTTWDPACTHGFVHRLDQPSTGLLLHAESYEALMLLRWQQDTLQLGREYLVLVHGNFAKCSAPISFDQPLQLRGGGSAVSPAGRPARTLAWPIAWLQSPGLDGDLYTLLAVRIVTGRKHQIRVHLSAAGYPVVCDRRYGRERLADDLAWCRWNFLHRHRLEFQDLNGTHREVTEALPPHLCTALSLLQPRSASDAVAVREWMAKPRPFRQVVQQ